MHSNTEFDVILITDLKNKTQLYTNSIYHLFHLLFSHFFLSQVTWLSVSCETENTLCNILVVEQSKLKGRLLSVFRSLNNWNSIMCPHMT